MCQATIACVACARHLRHVKSGTHKPNHFLWKSPKCSCCSAKARSTMKSATCAQQHNTLAARVREGQSQPRRSNPRPAKPKTKCPSARRSRPRKMQRSPKPMIVARGAVRRQAVRQQVQVLDPVHSGMEFADSKLRVACVKCDLPKLRASTRGIHAVTCASSNADHKHSHA